MKQLKLAALMVFLCTGVNGYNQTEETPKFDYHLEYVMGPYLFVDNIVYDAVFMNGCRLGFKLNPHFDFSIEYVVGQGEDVFNNFGMTHNANLQFAYYPWVTNSRFKPYFFTGGGFFEFKEFTTDVYGISVHAGSGTLLEFTPRVNGIIEARYLNTGLLDVNAENQLAVFWGARINF